MPFTHVTDFESGSHLQGFLPPTSYARLVEVFGEPTFTFGDKTQAEWCLRFEDGTLATIYDYKEHQPVAQVTNWHVGGFAPLALTRVANALGVRNYTTTAQRYGG